MECAPAAVTAGFTPSEWSIWWMKPEVDSGEKIDKSGITYHIKLIFIRLRWRGLKYIYSMPAVRHMVCTRLVRRKLIVGG